MLTMGEFPALTSSLTRPVYAMSTPWYSVAVNRELARFFPERKGLRPGDSSSSPLFVLEMDVFSKTLERAETSVVWDGGGSCPHENIN